MINCNKLLYVRQIRWIIAIAWTMILTIYLLQPETQPIMPTIPTAPPSLGRELLFSTLHLLVFAFTTLIWCFAINIYTVRDNRFWILAILLMGYSISIEYLQSNIPGRSTQVWDIIANSIGIGLGFFLWLSMLKDKIQGA